MTCWYGTGRTGWEWPLRIISMVLLWGMVISGIVALSRYLSGAQRATAPPAQAPTSERVGVEQRAESEIDELDYRERLDVFDKVDAAMRPTAGPTSHTVLPTAA
jgi:putative membrane protein